MVIFFMIVYPFGIPVAYFYMVWKYRERITGRFYAKAWDAKLKAKASQTASLCAAKLRHVIQSNLSPVFRARLKELAEAEDRELQHNLQSNGSIELRAYRMMEREKQKALTDKQLHELKRLFILQMRRQDAIIEPFHFFWGAYNPDAPYTEVLVRVSTSMLLATVLNCTCIVCRICCGSLFSLRSH